MTLDKAIKNLLKDNRMLEHNLKAGTITQKEHEAYLSQLPDLSANVDYINIEETSKSTDDSSH